MRRGYSIVAPHSAAAGGRHAAGETAMPMMAMRQSRYNAEAGVGLTGFRAAPFDRLRTNGSAWRGREG
jgi:hypothetical protein